MEAGYKQAVTARVGIALLQCMAAYAVAERVKEYYNQLKKISKNDKVSDEFQYDKRGNQSQKKTYKLDNNVPVLEYTADYEYTKANQLKKVTTSKEGVTQKHIQSYMYNGDGKRIRYNANGAKADEGHKYYYVGESLLYTASGTSGEKYTENVLDKEGQIVATKGESASPQYDFYHYDIRNSVTNIVKSEGSTKVVPTQENEYDIFGKTEQSATNSSKNEVKFTGALHEQQNGLYYMNARHYDPSTGRFLQQDVYKGEYGAPWTQNRYTYCGNNPVNMVDPSGHAFLTLAAIGFAVGSVVSATTQFLTTGKVSWKKTLVAGVAGAGFALLGPSGLALSSKMYIGAGIGATVGASNEIIDATDEKRKVDPVKLLAYSATGAISGAVGGFFGHVTMGTDGIVSNTGTVVSSFNAAAVESVTNSTVYYATTKNNKKVSNKTKKNYVKPVKKQNNKKPSKSFKTNNYTDTYKMYIPKAAGGYLPTPWDRIKSSRIWRG